VTCAGLVLVHALTAHAFDPLQAGHGLPDTPAAGLVPTAGCILTAPTVPLTLAQAVERALCRNPKTREAWAAVKAQAAAVGMARAAYLPTVSGTWQGVRDRTVTDIANQPQLSSNSAANVQSASLSLNWVLFDFGGRAAALRNAHALLAAARASQDATLQAVFAAVAKDYYAAEAAQGALAAARDIERMTGESMLAARDRVDRGVAPILDALQAQTQYVEAVFNLAKAEGEVQTALGTLASDMDADPGEPVTVPAITDTEPPGKTFDASVAQLMEEVKASHPSVLAAQAQVEAARAKVAQTRADGLPSVAFVAKYSRNNQPQSLGLGLPTYPATGHDAYIGVQVTIPFFEGFGRHYQIDAARADAERQEDVLDETQQQVALDVWKTYYALDTATQNADNSAQLLVIAQRAFDSARHRYRAGVGDILQVLNTQTALANARQRRVQALADWYTARLDLAARLGRLNLPQTAGR
jgi:outer membrane protein